ncbi:MAG TPA: aldehyde ferredoxin oxidoreductase, partial [Desulfobacteraceae bacterium]|nr:aldehyde ferredoxin oxidoreductase [Desulfobacteraceae bacterium]
ILTGTDAVGGSRYAMVGKSPLTGGWGDANSGGDVGPYLKFAGYDAVFFTGIADRPVYLYIDNGKVELKDAAGLWGKDTFETEDILKSECGKDIKAACIGPSGEKVSLIAAVMNDKGRAAGRSGLGAVMGSKKLKAVVLKGDMEVPVADSQKAKEMKKRDLKELTGHVDMLRKYGTPAIFTLCAEKDDAPTKNWAGVAPIDMPDYEKLGGDQVLARQDKRYGCWRCPIACGGHMKKGTGEYEYERGAHKPEYETLAMFGTDCLNSNLESIIKLNDICNRYGVDTISAGASIAFAIECYENGIITTKDTDGIEMNWGNHRSIVAMTEKLVRREGFGDVLADGVKAAAAKIGGGADQCAMHIQGQEIPAHDPKVGLQWAIAYGMDATPARHCQGGEGPLPPGVLPAYDRTSLKGRGKPHKVGKCFSHAFNAAGACMFVVGAFPSGDTFVESVRVISGWDVTMEEILRTGERIANMRQAFNIREGLNAREFRIPDRILGRPPKEVGPNPGVTLHEDDMYNEFLAAMDWDLQTCRPSKRKLQELGLEDVAEELYG